MRWLRRRPARSQSTQTQPRATALRGLPDKIPPKNRIPRNYANDNRPDLNDDSGILQEAVLSQPSSPPPGSERIALGHATVDSSADLIQAIHEEEELGWRRSSATAQPAELRNQLDDLDHSLDDFQSLSDNSAHHHTNLQPGELMQTGITDTESSRLEVPSENEQAPHAALLDEIPQAAERPSPTDIGEGLTAFMANFDAAPESPLRESSQLDWKAGIISSTEQNLSAPGDIPSPAEQNINSSSELAVRKPRQFSLAIPEPSFKFLPKQSLTSLKHPTRTKSLPSKQENYSLRERARSDDQFKPGTKKLRFSTEIHNWKPSSWKPSTKKKRSSGHKKAENIIRSNFAGTRSAEISPKSSTILENSITLTPFLEPTDQPTQPIISSIKIPKPKPYKPSRPSRPTSKAKTRIPLTPLSPTAIRESVSIPGQPYEHMRLPDDPDPHKKLRLAKHKGKIQRAIRKARKLTLRKSVLQVMLGRQLAGPVHANLSVISGKRSTLEGGPGPGLWGVAGGVLGERSLKRL